MWPPRSATTMFCIGATNDRVASTKAATVVAFCITRAVPTGSLSASSAGQRMASA